MRRLTILLAALGALLLVPAAQAFANNYSGYIKVNMAGTGSGEVVSYEEEEFWHQSNPPIACKYNGASKSGTCEAEVAEVGEAEEPGEIPFYVSAMEAIAAPGSEFAGWTLQKGGSTLQCPALSEPTFCTMSSNEEGEDEFEVLATFITPTALTIAKTGEGTITSNPAGIVCTGAKTGAECEDNFDKNSTVTLTASPASGYAFNSWAGCTTHVGLTCTVEMSKAKTVKAGFIATPSLTVEKAGSGAGKAAATGISCDESCSKATSAVKTGTSVTVKVTPAKGSEAAVFEGGTGSASGCSGASCTFSISENSSVKVKFNAIPTKTMTVSLAGPAKYKGKVSGKGIVKGLYGSAISCGTGCTTQTESFFSTDEVTLSAAAGTGYTFGGWSVSGGSAGTCTGTTTPCTLKTDANKTVSAEFK